MRSILIGILVLLSAQAWSQSSCKRSSPIFGFDQQARPRLFTEKLGNHPQFPFLQRDSGITTRALFIKAVKDAENHKKYAVEFTVFNHLLQDIGFARGYKDIKTANVENLFINPGTIGNLGFFNKGSNYIYVRLNPAGEDADGVAAWKVTGPSGCYFYILHTCGNAFFANEARTGGTGCCRAVGVRVAGWSGQWVICRDTVLELHIPPDTTTNRVEHARSDTVYIPLRDSGKEICPRKWEIGVAGGGSFNSIPRFDNTLQHTRTNGVRPVATLAVSRIFNHWFQAGISASYMSLSYQDDVAYPGSVPNSYNTVYPGKPIIPLQVFGRATIGGPIGWQATVSLSGGYSLVSGSRIVNSGNTLAAKPATKSGPTAGFGMGIVYFFSCRFGIGVSFDGQYFDNPASAMTYRLIALPVTAGLRFRF
jgi:hypothetical protein